MLFKKAYPPEVAQELGYQKEYPTKMGWFVLTIGTLIFGVFFTGVSVLAISMSGQRIEGYEQELCNNPERKPAYINFLEEKGLLEANCQKQT